MGGNKMSTNYLELFAVNCYRGADHRKCAHEFYHKHIVEKNEK